MSFLLTTITLRVFLHSHAEIKSPDKQEKGSPKITTQIYSLPLREITQRLKEAEPCFFDLKFCLVLALLFLSEWIGEKQSEFFV